MHVVLIPGFWLDASSWDPVLPALRAAGHRVHPVTLPGLESRDADRSGIGLRDHVNAVIRRVDELAAGHEPIALVGHSGGGAVAHAVVDARPDRVARVVYVDSGPLGDGACINDGFPAQSGEIPLPAWDVFEKEELVDLDDEARAAFRRRAIPMPARVATDRQVLSDERRYAVPATIITSTFPAATMRELMAQDHPQLRELAKIEDFEIVELPTGHWPQLTKPTELAEALVTALRYR
ncbi:alpha/beta hydrolase [Nannocystis sp. SCPEA4]|uniref:alpha/beta fold hydrolase n=1 Tax=Nannocystis sp. SCPEA4 TaxID=2996787 RepID=UPI00226D65B7|nr:alpha/beta hydrolase [Nannocystis sp. SCPEA4]MCY1054823.1 alpha/beta hydrolase [Nannocystis sp. SCPEA4]